MSKAEDIAKAIYIKCFDDEFKYPEVLNALRICAEEDAETIAQLHDENTMQKQYNAKLLKGDIDKSNKISALSSKVYILQKKNDELKEEVEMYGFIYEGNGFKRRGLNNAIQIADYIEKLEKQIERMKEEA